MSSFKCTKCGKNVKFIDEYLRDNESKKIYCSCGAEFEIKKSEPTRVKLKTFGNTLLKGSMKALEKAAIAVKTAKEDYDMAEEKLHQKNFDLWNEKRLELEATRSDSIYEKLIIKQRLHNLRNSSAEEDE